jgi:hypothetical protein
MSNDVPGMTGSPPTGGERHLSPKRVALILRYMGDDPDGGDPEGPGESQVLPAESPPVVGTASHHRPAGSANGMLDTARDESVAPYQLLGPPVRRQPFARLGAFVRARRPLLGWAALIIGVAVVIGLLIPHLA